MSVCEKWLYKSRSFWGRRHLETQSSLYTGDFELVRWGGLIQPFQVTCLWFIIRPSLKLLHCVLCRNQQDNRGFRGHNRQPYGGRFSHGQSYSNERQWGDGNRDKSSGGFYHCRRDQFLPKDNYDHVHYAGIRERVRRDDDGPPPKASRQTDAQQSHWFCFNCS